jgi:hypothetical protein
MHDKDCAISLSVQDPSGQTWTSFRDKRALDVEDEDNKTHYLKAVGASADEIYSA